MDGDINDPTTNMLVGPEKTSLSPPLAVDGKAEAKGTIGSQSVIPDQGGVDYIVVRNTLAELVAAGRRELGWSQARLAREAGVGESSIAHIETNRITKPSRRVLQRIAIALRMEVGPLLDAAGYTDEDQVRFEAAVDQDRNLRREEKEVLKQMYRVMIGPEDR